jgi:hypothetical protein
VRGYTKTKLERLRAHNLLQFKGSIDCKLSAERLTLVHIHEAIESSSTPLFPTGCSTPDQSRLLYFVDFIRFSLVFLNFNIP